MQFAALRCFFPLHSSPLRIAGGASTGGPKHMSLTGDLHQKPTRNKMMYWASRSYRESAKLLFFPLCESHWQNLSSFQADWSTHSTYSSNPSTCLCNKAQTPLVSGNISGSKLLVATKHPPKSPTSPFFGICWPHIWHFNCVQSLRLGWAEELASDHRVRG